LQELRKVQVAIILTKSNSWSDTKNAGFWGTVLLNAKERTAAEEDVYGFARASIVAGLPIATL
jgi:hypothetical protein